MKKYLHILSFAFKEQLEYRLNFFLGIFTMVVNDFIFLLIFVVFLSYFTGTWLTFGNFLIVHSIIAFQYALINWVFSNIGNLPNIIEEWKLDYYLSFPTNVLWFIACAKINLHNLWDILFALIAMVVYAFHFHDGAAGPFIIKRLIISVFFLMFAAWLFILVWSVSFWLQKWSKVRDLFQSFFLVFGSYPPDIFRQKKLIFIMVSMIWLYPWVFLPYWMMTGKSNVEMRWILILASIAMFILWIFIFHKWLKRYSSWNLVVQM